MRLIVLTVAMRFQPVRAEGLYFETQFRPQIPKKDRKRPRAGGLGLQNRPLSGLAF